MLFHRPKSALRPLKRTTRKLKDTKTWGYLSLVYETNILSFFLLFALSFTRDSILIQSLLRRRKSPQEWEKAAFTSQVSGNKPVLLVVGFVLEMSARGGNYGFYFKALHHRWEETLFSSFLGFTFVMISVRCILTSYILLWPAPELISSVGIFFLSPCIKKNQIYSLRLMIQTLRLPLHFFRLMYPEKSRRKADSVIGTLRCSYWRGSRLGNNLLHPSSVGNANEGICVDGRQTSYIQTSLVHVTYHIFPFQGRMGPQIHHLWLQQHRGRTVCAYLYSVSPEPIYA